MTFKEFCDFCVPCGVSLQYLVSFLRNARLEGTIWVIKYKASPFQAERNRPGAERPFSFKYSPLPNTIKSFLKPYKIKKKLIKKKENYCVRFYRGQEEKLKCNELHTSREKRKSTYN